MISTEHLIRHAAWADHKLFSAVAQLPASVLDLSLTPDSWPIKQQLQHLVGSLEWYRYVLAGAQWTDLTPPASAAEILKLRDYAATLFELLLPEAAAEDALVTFEDEDGLKQALRSTVVCQISYHATEHRAHIAAILELHGIEDIKLDDYDLWSYAAELRNRG